MEPSEFKRLVERGAGEGMEAHPFVDAAVLRTLRQKKTLYQGDVQEAIALIHEWCEKYIAPVPKGEDEEGNSISSTSAAGPTSTEFLAGERLVDKLSPLVRALRENVFGHSEAPFETVADAASWVEQESEADLKDWREDSEERDKAREQIKKLAREHGIEIEEKHSLLTYQRPDDDHVKLVPVVPDTRLYRLARETKRISSKIGLPEDAFTMHVLTGLQPMPSRVRIKSTQTTLRLPDGEQVCSRWVEAKFFARDLTDEELRKVYSSLRESIGSKGDGRLNDEDRDFWELMQEMEAPPQQNKGEFWEEALRRWKQLYPDTAINIRDGVKRKYERLSERLNGPR